MAHWDFSWDFALRLGLALVVGSILGLNRWLHHKSAGMRTHALVSVGAATALMLNSQIPNYDAQAVSHVLQGLITGLGFLGAGVIIQEGTSQKIHGLTTAASIWITMLIGAALGMGQIMLGTMAVVATGLVLVVGNAIERLVDRQFGGQSASAKDEDLP